MTPFDTCAPREPGGGKPPPQVSFEFFPPNTPALAETLWRSVERLAPLGPRFVSVTYGAGGSTRERTHALVERLRDETALEPAAHLTCVGAARGEVDAVARRYWRAGVRHIVALRGDPQKGESRFVAHAEGYSGSVALIEGLKRIADFEISAAAYPEPHPDSREPGPDLDYLKRKIDAGAVRLITQFFFDNSIFLRFRDRLAAAGIGVPLVPGILPVTNFVQVKRFSAACGATVPAWLEKRFEGLEDDPESRKLLAAATCAEQCNGLAAEGVDGYHFYTLNRADLVYAICHMLGLRPLPVAVSVCGDKVP
jgi:methylenetetrahydrofolate reductase (NADPH)